MADQSETKEPTVPIAEEKPHLADRVEKSHAFKWLKIIAVIVAVVGSTFAIYFGFAKNDSVPPSQQSTTQQANDLSSQHSYVEHLEALRQAGDADETANYKKSVIGKTITWTGYMRAITFESGAGFVIGESVDDNAMWNTIYADCKNGSNPEIQLHVLRNGDHVEITAVFYEWNGLNVESIRRRP
jgi:hypothetical protein